LKNTGLNNIHSGTLLEVFGVDRAPKKYEEYAYVLDDLPHGRSLTPRTQYHGKPVIQMIGETYFTLLEAVPRDGVSFNVRERIYVGKKGRTKVEHILGRVTYAELTSASKSELPFVIEMIVKADEKRFIIFFNESQPVTPRMHSMELIPGIGKRLMWQILEQRERVPFDSLEDLKSRVNIPDPAKLITRRVLKELSEDEKYQIFTRTIG
jgi:putative nucleotide binding protein